MYLIPEKIIAYRTVEEKQTSWNASLDKIKSAVKQKGVVESDAFDGSFVVGVTDD